MVCKYCGAKIPDKYLEFSSFSCPGCGRKYVKKTAKVNTAPQKLPTNRVKSDATVVSKKTRTKPAHTAASPIVFILLSTLAFFLISLVYWIFTTWANLKVDELIYTLKFTAGGTSKDLVADGVISTLVPTAVCTFITNIALYCLHHLKKIRRLKKKQYKKILTYGKMISTAAIIFVMVFFAYKIDLVSYFVTYGTLDFIEENYVNPQLVDIQFPSSENKKNLIYIFLESTEITCTDKNSGGTFTRNVLPGLTALSQKNENFSGDNTTLNGAYVPPGATWTMAAMFAHTSGIPLQMNIRNLDSNDMNKQDHFFADVVTMGDILKDEGYNQTLLIGSDADFGGRSLYFNEHGNFSIKDYDYAKGTEFIPSDYYVWWGYEDAKLFEFAKDELVSLAAKNEPFSLVMLTADTHFEDGYVCEHCGSEFANDQYSNVFRCSDSMVCSFVEWIEQQDFYEDTVIVLAGDHLTMDADYYKDVDSSYERKVYTSFINSEKEPENDTYRAYSTFDFFPTTISALGAEIKGDRLGLGTDLFSGEETLVERYGLQEFTEKVSRRSPMLQRMGNVVGVGKADLNSTFDKETNSVNINIFNVECEDKSDIERLEIWITDDSGKETTVPISYEAEENFVAKLDYALLDHSLCTLEVMAIYKNGDICRLLRRSGDISLAAQSSILDYLDLLAKKTQYVVFISACDEATSALTPEHIQKLKDLGLKTDLTGKFRYSYYTILEPGKDAIEALSPDSPLSLTGRLRNGTPYFIASAGYTTGLPTASIIINGTEYAQNSRGLNFVVYDYKTGQVVNSSVFDTYANP